MLKCICKMVIRFLYPNEYYNSVFEIDYDKLKKMGIELLVFDIDETLVGYKVFDVEQKLLDLLEMLKAAGFQILLLSNNRKGRVGQISTKLNLQARHRALKPFPFVIDKLLDEMKIRAIHTAIIGDQIFTDVICGKLEGLHTILVNPITERKEFYIRWRRSIEEAIIKKYKFYFE